MEIEAEVIKYRRAFYETIAAAGLKVEPGVVADRSALSCFDDRVPELGDPARGAECGRIVAEAFKAKGAVILKEETPFTAMALPHIGGGFLLFWGGCGVLPDGSLVGIDPGEPAVASLPEADAVRAARSDGERARNIRSSYIRSSGA